MGMGMRVSTVTYSSVSSRTLRKDETIEGEFTIYGKYMLVLQCLRYLLLSGLELYLNIFKSNPFPLRLGNIISKHLS
jgi:hypothetical protein